MVLQHSRPPAPAATTNAGGSSQPPIVVIAYNRPRSLRRLLDSLVAARCPDGTKLIISIDGGGADAVVSMAESFDWPAGDKEVLSRTDHMGLREHVLACGDLTDRYGAIVVLEDDLLVSPVFYEFARQASRFFADRSEIGGIGLYAYRRNLASGLLFEPITDDADHLFIQYACSWGQVWSADQWSRFRRWYSDRRAREADSPGVPDYVRKWPESSWLKYHIKYLVDTDRYFVSPRVSLATCFQDAGQHSDSTSSVHQVPIQLLKTDFRFKHLDDSNCVYDAFHTIIPDRLNRLVPELSRYDYVIDFHGVKPLRKLGSSHVLGCLNSTSPIKQYGCDLRPIEMNVIVGRSGRGITLSRVVDVVRSMSLEHHAMRVYPELGIRRLFLMLRYRLVEKFRKLLRRST